MTGPDDPDHVIDELLEALGRGDALFPAKLDTPEELDADLDRLLAEFRRQHPNASG